MGPCEAFEGTRIYCGGCGHALWVHTHMKETREPGRVFHRLLHPLEKSAAERFENERANTDV